MGKNRFLRQIRGFLNDLPWPSECCSMLPTPAMCGWKRSGCFDSRWSYRSSFVRVGLMKKKRNVSGVFVFNGSMPVIAIHNWLIGCDYVHDFCTRSFAGRQTMDYKNSIRVLHVHDLPLTGTTLKLQENFKTPVVIDFHENYPDALRTWFEWRKNPFVKLKNRLFMNPERWTVLERKAAHESDRVIAVVDEMKSRDNGLSTSRQ